MLKNIHIYNKHIIRRNKVPTLRNVKVHNYNDKFDNTSGSPKNTLLKIQFVDSHHMTILIFL